jgi:DNA-binding transcriptional LysR family regulator
MGGASTLMWPIVIPAVSRFIRANPNVKVEMTVRELAELPSLLQSGHVDMLITCGKINRPHYEEIYLGDEINVLVESRQFDKIPEVYLDHHPDDRTTIEYLKVNNNSMSKLNRAYYDDINGILVALESGLGRAVVPLHMLSQHKSLQVVRGQRKLKVPVYLCFMKHPFYSKLHREAIEVIKREVPRFLNI